MAKSYKHVGTQPIVVTDDAGERQIEPGQAFEATLAPAQEAFWLKTRAIEVAANVPAAPVSE